MIKKFKRMPWRCWFALGHDDVFIHADGDWLLGGTYFWQCNRCERIHATNPRRNVL